MSKEKLKEFFNSEAERIMGEHDDVMRTLHATDTETVNAFRKLTIARVVTEHRLYETNVKIEQEELKED